MPSARSNSGSGPPGLAAFGSEVVDRLRAGRNAWKLPWGELRIPRVFGFCHGVKRALAILERAVADESTDRTRLLLLGEIIHNLKNG